MDGDLMNAVGKMRNLCTQLLMSKKGTLRNGYLDIITRDLSVCFKNA